MLHWHVVQTKPRREGDVLTLLTQGGFEAFFPKIQDLFYRQATSHFRLAPLFPSYLFVHADFVKNSNFHLVKFTRGINKILCFDNRPIPISDDIIQTLRSRTNEEGIVRRQNVFNKGDRIRVRKGMLKELIGIIEQPIPAEGRVRVLLKLVNYEMKVKLHWTEVEKLKVA